MPAYLNPARCFTVTWWPSVNWIGFSYTWDRGWYDRYDGYNWSYDRRTDLSYAIADLVRGFERNDRRAVEELIPRSGAVNIYVDGSYSYSLQAEDFYDVMMDAIDSSQTVRYEIVEVRRNRGTARVLARHDYTDPWGDRQSVYHTYFLEEDRGGMVIREFGTSSRRIW
jgi:hypothetical protein